MTNTPRRAVAIVDDDDAVRGSLELLLLIAGHATKSFASAAEFLKSQLHNFGCLILDHHMPQTTGLELAERMHKLGINLPTLLITGSPSPEIVRRAEELGILRVLEKPLPEAELLEFVASTLHRFE